MVREKSQDGSSPLFDSSVKQVFIAVKKLAQLHLSRYLSMSLRFSTFGFPAGILGWLGDRHI
ncbi:hypothetical protein QT986_19770 [Microcoleus sp. herbarium14]